MSIRYCGSEKTSGPVSLWEETSANLPPNQEQLKCNGKNFYYVSQDNYAFFPFNPEKNIRFYCDSATSCIIILVTGKDKFMLAHLSRPGRFENFFKLVRESFFEDIEIYAAGANPPEPIQMSNGKKDYTALRNSIQTAFWVGAMSPSDKERKAEISRLTLRLGEGNPSIKKNNLDCLGIWTNSREISNERLQLTLEDRDPTGGLQTLFCVFGNPNVIRNQASAFNPEQIDTLVTAAKAKQFEDAANMTDEEILHRFSSTPDFEVEWFADTIRQAANFVLHYDERN